jgi:ABC-type transporter Mla subunit MlaD
MYTKRAEFKAGAVVLLAIAALLALLYFAGGSEPIWGDWRYVHIRFAQGFVAPKVGDPAELNGVPIGRVKQVLQREEIRGEGSDIPLTSQDRIELGLAEGQTGTVREVYVLAILKMPSEQVIPRGTTAQIDKSLTGIRTLALVPGLEGGNLTDEETEATPIPGREAASLADISGKVTELVGKIDSLVGSGEEVMIEAKALLLSLRAKVDAFNTVELDRDARAAVRSLRETLEGLGGKIDVIATNLEAASAGAKDTAAGANAAVGDLRADLEEVMAALKSVAQRLDRIVERAQAPVEEILANLRTASRDVSGVAQQFSGIGPEVRRILGDVGVDIDLFLQTLTDTAHNLQDASEDLRANPWKLLNKPDVDEIAFENLRAASLAYMRAMRDVSQASARLLALLGRDDLDQPEVQRLLQRATQAFQSAMDRYQRDEQRWQELFRQANPRRSGR